MIIQEKDWPKRQLQKQCKELSDRLLWEVTLKKENIYIYPMKSPEWLSLLMTHYHKEVIQLIQTIPKGDRFFSQTKVNRFKQLSIWCIRSKYSELILEKLKGLNSIQLENLAENYPIHANH